VKTRPLKTLERVLSKAGAGSRVDARGWIRAGRVTVNGQVVRDPDSWIDMGRDRVRLDGKPLQARERIYLLLYKPTGYLTTYRDPHGPPTVYDLIADLGTFVSPVGRLDLDTSGLLLMTNDNQLAERVTNPASHVPKTYLVKASMRLTDEQLQQLRDGVELADGPTRPARVRRVRDSEEYTHLEITLTEGRNRQVRRMIEALGATVLKLVRVKIGSISIGVLQIGKWRLLTEREVRELRPEYPQPGVVQDLEHFDVSTVGPRHADVNGPDAFVASRGDFLVDRMCHDHPAGAKNLE
jgi:pseudouridine synthase